MIQTVSRYMISEYEIPISVYKAYKKRNKFNSLILGDDSKQCWAMCRIKDDRYVVDHIQYQNEEALLVFLSELDDKSKAINGKYLEIRVNHKNLELCVILADTGAFLCATASDDQDIYCFYN